MRLISTHTCAHTQTSTRKLLSSVIINEDENKLLNPMKTSRSLLEVNGLSETIWQKFLNVHGSLMFRWFAWIHTANPRSFVSAKQNCFWISLCTYPNHEELRGSEWSTKIFHNQKSKILTHFWLSFRRKNPGRKILEPKKPTIKHLNQPAPFTHNTLSLTSSIASLDTLTGHSK